MPTVDLSGSVVLSPADAIAAGVPQPPKPTTDGRPYVAIDTPMASVMDTSRGKTFSIPQGLSSPEAAFLLQRYADKKPAQDFVGAYHAPGVLEKSADWFMSSLTAAGKGAEAAVVSLPQIPATLKLESGQTYRQGLSQPLAASDYFNLFNPAAPTGAVAASMEKIKQHFFGGNFDTANKHAARMINEAKTAIKQNQRTLERMGLTREQQKNHGLAFDVGSGGVTIGAAMAASLITRSPAVATLFFAAQANASTYQEAIKAGKGPLTAAHISSVNAALQGAIMAVGFGSFIRLGAIDSGIKKVVSRTVEQALMMGGIQATDETVTQASGVRPVDITGGLERVGYAAALAVLIGAPLSAGSGAFEGIVKKSSVDPVVAENIFSKMQDNKDELIASATDIIKNINANIAIDPKAQKEVTDIIKKFNAGEPINVADIIKNAPPSVAGSLASVIQSIEVKKGIAATIKKGRVSSLDKGISALDKQIAEIDGRIQDREKIGKPVKALQNKIDKLAAKRSDMEIEQANITLPRVAGDARGPLDVKAPKMLTDANKAINDKITGLGKAKTALNEDLTRAKTAGDKTLINRIQRKRTAMNKEIKAAEAELAANEAKFRAATSLANKDVSVKASVIDSLNKATEAAAIRAVRKGFRAGVKAAKDNVKAAQAGLTALVKGSGLLPADQAKFLATIKALQTPEQLQRRLPGIQSRVVGLLDIRRRSEIHAAVKKVLRRSKPIRSGKKPVGKLTPETQRVIDKARDIIKLSKAAAEIKLEEALASETPSPDAAFENRLLAIAAKSKDLSIAKMESALSDLATVRRVGLEGGKLRRGLQSDKITRLATAVGEATTEGADIAASETSSIAARVKARARSAGDTVSSLWANWQTILDDIINKKGVDATKTIEDLSVHHELQAQKAIMRDWHNQFVEIGMEAFGFKSQGKLMAKLAKDSKRRNLGTFIDASGRERVLEYSVDEARKLWMEFQDPTIADTLADPFGNALTASMQNHIFYMLNAEDMAFARAQFDFYQRTYKDINKVYSAIYGVDLPSNPLYSPITRDRGAMATHKAGGDVVTVDSFLVEQNYRRAITSARLKDRVANVHPLAQRGDTAVLVRYISDMTHFISLAEKARTLNSVFGNARLRKEIKAKHSAQMLRQIDSFVADLTSGYLERGQVFEDAINFFNRNFVRSVIAGKIAIGVKQLTSTFAYAENITAGEFASGLVDFMKHPIEVVKFLHDASPLLQERRSAPELEIAKLGAGDPELIAFRKNQTVDNMLSAFVRIGDLGAIYPGSWAVYRAAIKAGKSQQEAVAAFEKITADTQQSKDIDQLSVTQRGGPLGRTLSMFLSSPMALMRREIMAIRQFRRGDISARAFGKQMAIYHIIIPSVFTLVASAFLPDKDKQITAFAMGSFNGLVILGDIIKNTLYDMLADKKSGFSRSTRGLPVAEVISEIFRGVRGAFQSTDSEELTTALKILAKGGGQAVGLPVSQGFNFVDGTKSLAKGEKVKGPLLVLGWPPSVANKH